MRNETTILEIERSAGAEFVDIGGATIPARFSDARREYDALDHGLGLHDRSYRGLIEVAGADRAKWLHNLTTNHVTDVPAGQGRYLFACNVKGRILFDANCLILPEAIWLDVDRRWVATAMRHLEKYHITEDVALKDRSDEFVRLALAGAGEHSLLSASSGSRVPSASRGPVGRMGCWWLRTDFCGIPAAELVVPVEQAGEAWRKLSADGAVPVGLEAIQMRRIEAGLPWSCEDLDEEVLPAETGQLERAVSFNKGCYLGQEVVERMRAHGVMARRLVGLRGADDGVFPAGAGMHLGDTAVGRVTSSCVSPRIGGPIGLGYVRSAQATAGAQLEARWDAGRAMIAVADLPFARSPRHD